MQSPCLLSVFSSQLSLGWVSGLGPLPEPRCSFCPKKKGRAKGIFPPYTVILNFYLNMTSIIIELCLNIATFNFYSFLFVYLFCFLFFCWRFVESILPSKGYPAMLSMNITVFASFVTPGMFLCVFMVSMALFYSFEKSFGVNGQWIC